MIFINDWLQVGGCPVALVLYCLKRVLGFLQRWLMLFRKWINHMPVKLFPLSPPAIRRLLLTDLGCRSTVKTNTRREEFDAHSLVPK